MNKLKTTFDTVYKGISANKTAFFSVFFVVVLLTYAVLYALDFYPEPVSEEQGQDMVGEVESAAITPESESTPAVTEQIEATGVVTAVEQNPVRIELPDNEVLPTRITIPNSGTDVMVLNPDSLDMADLDNALLDGVVRHPQSAHFADTGNILIFGHSSYLPNVFNENFQAFNGVQDLNWGDEITLYSETGTEYVYRVSRVYRVKASETIIDNSRGKGKLTIVTCNSFGSKDDRYIVEATLVESNA